MSDSNEPSYYEIALTNRQVLVAFVILLLAVLLAFLGGVWLGRRGATTASQAAGRGQEQAAMATSQSGQSPLKQFNFFSDEEKAGKAKANAAVKPQPQAQGSTSASTLEGQVAKGAAGSSGNEVAEKPAPAPAGAAGTSAKTAIEPPPQAHPSSQPSAEPPTTKSTQAAVAAPSSPFPDTTTGDLVIQVFSSANLQQAKEITSRLKKAGYRAFLSPVKVGGQVLHRVRIGPFEQRSEAAQVAEKIRKSFKLDTWITH